MGVTGGHGPYGWPYDIMHQFEGGQAERAMRLTFEATKQYDGGGGAMRKLDGYMTVLDSRHNDPALDRMRWA